MLCCRRVVSSGSFSALFIKKLSHSERVGHGIGVLQQTKCFVVHMVAVGSFAFLFNCTPAGQTSDSVTVRT